MEFVQTRASYVGQTSLYGYLKARMGTRYRVMFEDDVFSASIRDAAVKVFIACLADLTIFTVAVAAAGGRLRADEAQALARHCFQTALDRGLTEVDPDQIPADAVADFEARTVATAWSNAAQGPDTFQASGRGLIRHAPVVDEFKELDQEIVQNSIRFRWRDIREQARKRFDGAAIAAAWRDRAGAPAATNP